MVGYDKRFASEHFAAACAEVLAANGLRVWLTDGATPTPVISYAVVDKKAAGAINITASTIRRPIMASRCVTTMAARLTPVGLKEIEALIPESSASSAWG